MAGVFEHVIVYPLDTVRTHIQVCAACHFNPESHNPVTQAKAKQHSLATTQATTTTAATNVTMSEWSKNITNTSSNNSKNIPGSILQKATSTATGMPSTMSSMSKSAIANTTQKIASVGTAIGGGGGATHNLSMFHAIRQLVSQPLVLDTGGASAASASAIVTTHSHSQAGATTAGTTTTTAVVDSASAWGAKRLWRGVQTILIGCIPAQLGHYNSFSHALTTMIRNEGVISLVRSFPITLATNIPYGMIMVGTNEFLKRQWQLSQQTHENQPLNEIDMTLGVTLGASSLAEIPQTTMATITTNNESQPLSEIKMTLGVTLGASSLAGLVAAATTTPLDRIKTYLQTQQLAPSCLLQQQGIHLSSDLCPISSHTNTTTTSKVIKPLVADFREAALRIYQNEGPAGFFRGVTPRILSHTPAVAISWTTYETAKKYLQHAFVE
eukprot:CAMPEP_0170838166 /NCGR_PEP_ID=MMETSP0734-20130129/3232_1 /TAXON_ID=186038 /ORGANISM="Fragilariopsis kerguelensis, Strain L26-C5" /LENGTH=440 /DNA_ID=CAMNT_0011205555 /DNA_START=1 /DNA_END=1324 /DNA_ORIENTATION=-